MKTRRVGRRILRSQSGGGKVKPNNALNALTRRMGTLRVGKPKRSVKRFGKTSKKLAASRIGTTVIQRPGKQKRPSKPIKTLRTFVKSGIVRRANAPLRMEQFEPVQYIQKVGVIFQGLGGVRERIETAEKVQLLDDFDMIIQSIHEGLPTIYAIIGKPAGMNTNNAANIDDILEEIKTVGERLVAQSEQYRINVRGARKNMSVDQIRLISIAEAVNQVLIQSVAEIVKPENAEPENESADIADLVAQLGDMKVTKSAADDLASLLDRITL